MSGTGSRTLASAEVRTGEGKLHLFVAIDRTSKFAVARLCDEATRRTACRSLEEVLIVIPYKLHTILILPCLGGHGVSSLSALPVRG